MRSALNFRDPKLWADKASDAIWRAFKQDLDQRIENTFEPDRQNAVVDIRKSQIQRTLDFSR